MPIIQGLEQGSEKWLDYRRSKVMATDSAIIVGTNTFRTPLQLWEEKLLIKEKDPVNDAMKRGSELEPDARDMACLELGIEFEPFVYESDDHPWMASSLDGLSKCGRFILEIKCPKEMYHVQAQQGIIQPYYITQMQHQMRSKKDVEKCFFFSYRPENTIKPFVIIEVTPDEEMQQHIVTKGHEFYINMCTMNPPHEAWKFSSKK